MLSSRAVSSLLLRSSRTLARSRTTSLKSNKTANNNKTLSKRFMSGDHDTPVPQSMKARMWEGHPTEPEGWELTYGIWSAISMVMIVICVGFVPDTTIKSWAQTEARTRLALLESGQIDKVEFGRHYYQEMVQSGTRIDQWEKVMNKGINPADDDDDDEEEEEEEE